MPDNTNFSFEVYQVPEGQKRAGWWTFKIGGKDSLYYSSTQEAALRHLTAVLNGPAPGAVRLQPLHVDASRLQGQASGEHDPNVREPKTMPERIDAFMTRGKLGHKQETE